jgi:hypothetical protein
MPLKNQSHGKDAKHSPPPRNNKAVVSPALFLVHYNITIKARSDYSFGSKNDLETASQTMSCISGNNSEKVSRRRIILRTPFWYQVFNNVDAYKYPKPQPQPLKPCCWCLLLSILFLSLILLSSRFLALNP